MPDWVEYVRQHLSLPGCSPVREAEIVEELAQQLDDAYQESLESGLSEQQALVVAAQHVSDWRALANDLIHAGIGQARKPACSLESPRPVRSRAGGLYPELKSGKKNFKARVASMMETIRQDLYYAVRMFAKKPLFAFTAILTLAIGIGANTAIFSVVHSVLLRALPYPESNRLTVVWSALGQEGRAPASGPELLSLRERSRLFDQFAGIWVQNGALTGQGEPEQVKLGWVTANFLPLLSAHAQKGRFFLPQEEGSGSDPVMVISHELWQRHYGSDPNIVGRSVMMSGHSYTIVGILPAGFRLMFPEGASVPPNVDVYAPFRTDFAKQPRDQNYIRMIGRLRDGVTVQQAQVELDNIATRLRSEFHEYSEQDLHLQALSLQGDVAHNVRPALIALFAGTGLVLLIVCANMAMLLFSRASERRGEMSVRAALGAEPGRLIRQLLTESVFLSCLGGIAALGVSWAILKVLLLLEPNGIARTTSIGLNLTVLAFNIAVSLICGILFGLSPALEARSINLVSVLRESSRGMTERKHVTRQLLIGCEVALTFVLLTSSVLLIRTFIELLQVQPGFQSRNVLTFQLSLPGVRYPSPQAADQFLRELHRRLSSLPGVRAAGIVSHLPFDDSLPNWYDYYWREGAPKQEQNTLMADHRSVYPGFFDAMGIAFVAGRNFDSPDEVSHRKVVIIDDSLAKQLWPGEDATGKQLNVQNGNFVRDTAVVVGVVKHVQYHSLTNQVRPQIYLPYLLAARSNMSVAVLAGSSPESLIPLVREEVRKLDKDLPLANVRLMDDYVSDARRATRFVTVLCGSLGVIALVLSCVGIYGVTFSTVASRTREIGIRMALGAQRHNVAAMILRRSMMPVVIGSALGLVLSIAITPLLSSLFFGVRPIDPIVLVSVLMFLCLVGLLASSLPTQRVIRGNPIAALRCE